MENKYIINDTREQDNFKKSSYSRYKRADIFTEFIKSCEKNKL